MISQLSIKPFILTAYSLLLSVFVFGGAVVLEGHYQQKNVYVQNSYTDYGIGFCAYEVSVNGHVSTDEVNSNAFEVDLSLYDFSYGDPVVIVIKHKEAGCFPKVLNPEVLKPNPTFETSFISIEENGTLKWSTVNETAKIPFVIEQFKWNKWVKVGEIQGVGKPMTNLYEFKTNAIAGVNKFRVKQKGYIDKTKFSPSVSYTSMKKEVSYVYVKGKKRIDFSQETGFEIYDKFGNLVKKGHASSVSMANLKKDTYYMNYGNTMAVFRKK
jgi:hypothetical protein